MSIWKSQTDWDDDGYDEAPDWAGLVLFIIICLIALAWIQWAG